MPLEAVRCSDNATLWRAFADAFLAEIGDRRGPAGYPSQAWLTHRVQRDLFLTEAAARGLRGWLAPPVAFLSDLPRLFDIRDRRIGVLQRQVLVGRLTAKYGADSGFGDGTMRFDRPGVSQAVDSFLGELLPEGVSPAVLKDALAGVERDEFARRRNEWLVGVYSEFVATLAAEGEYDHRAVHAVVADKVEKGGLRKALRGANRLHIYGLTTPRTRRRLLQSLRSQPDVRVTLYLPSSIPGDEWGGLLDETRDLPPAGTRAPLVQPAPDARREFEYVALEIKKLLTSGGARADRIAVVARTGLEDTRYAHDVLREAGIPATARVRRPLGEIPAIKAVLLLFEAAAHEWDYRRLRQVLDNFYFDVEVDLRSIDHLAGKRRVQGLANWINELGRLEERLKDGADQDAPRGFFADRVGKDRAQVGRVAGKVLPLTGSKPVSEWIKVTRDILDPGWFDFRQRLCRDHGGLWDLVRLDQQGVELLDEMLTDWHTAPGAEESLSVKEWTARLRRVVAGNELALSTPQRTGVQILEAHEAALAPFEHLFLVHANDGEFPKRGVGGGLLSEEERSELASRGLPLATRATTLLREQALWGAVAGSQDVTITYRTANPDGVPLLPSLLVPVHDQTTEIPRTRFVWPDAYNAQRVDASAAEALLKTAETGGQVKAARPGRLHQAIVAAYAESRRRGSRDGTRAPGMLGPWCGEIRDPAVLTLLEKRYGAEHLWSPSQLELYGQNPFVFLIQRVLWISELEEASEDTDVMTFGSVAHRLLERFYQRYTGPFPAEFDGSVQEVYSIVANEAFGELEKDLEQWLGLRTLWAVRKRQIQERVSDYLGWELPKLSDRRPERVEHIFGDEATQVRLKGKDLSGKDSSFRIRGRIDRVDAGTSRAVHHVVDYKTGQTPSGSGYEDGGVLQGPLYLAVLAEQLKLTPGEAAYRSIKDHKVSAKVEYGSAECEAALRIALAIPGRVRAGKFEPRAAKSVGWKNYWPGLAVCRVEAVVEEGSRFDD